MSLLESIHLYDVQHAFQRLLEDAELGLVADNSGYVYVDGEEGDHGVVRYHDANGHLVAVKTIHGGDSEDYALTPHGAVFVKQLLLNLFSRVIEEKVTGDPELA
jgi:hypothetical protein